MTDRNKAPPVNGWRPFDGMPGAKCYRKQGVMAFVTVENGLYHISLSRQDRLPSYDELKDARYSLAPDGIYMAQIFPPQSEFVNLHPFCLHLYQLSQNEMKGIAA